MAKTAYVGVNNIARKIKAGYVGVRTAFPIYEEQTKTETKTIAIDGSNIDTYFTVAHTGSYGFTWDSTNSQFRSTNGGVASSNSTTTLTAKQALTNVSFYYAYGSESNYDKYSITVDGTALITNSSGTNSGTKSSTYSLSAGDVLKFVYSKDGSVDKNGDYAAFYNMSVTATVTTTETVQTGTTYKNVARKILKAYIGDSDGKALILWGGEE